MVLNNALQTTPDQGYDVWTGSEIYPNYTYYSFSASVKSESPFLFSNCRCVLTLVPNILDEINIQ